MLYSLTCAEQRGVIVSIVHVIPIIKLAFGVHGLIRWTDTFNRLLWRTGDIEDSYTNPKDWIRKSGGIFKRIFFHPKEADKVTE